MVPVSVRSLWTWSFTWLFVALKLTEQIDWNWLLVLSPLFLNIVFVQLLSFLVAYRTTKTNNQNAGVEPQSNQPDPTGLYI